MTQSASSQIRRNAQDARKAYLSLGALPGQRRDEGLLAIADALLRNRETIFEANRLDVAQAEREALAAPLLGRLRFTPDKCARVVEGLRALAALPDPLNHVTYAKELAQGLRLYRCTCAIGVVGVIFESRPDALVQIASLCLKSGNGVLLKGGREALRTNEALFSAIVEGTAKAGLPDGWCALLRTREDVADMLRQDDCIDLIIPRGSNEFVRYIMQNSLIPVLGHSDGVCHVYVDEHCDPDAAVRIVADSKAQNLSVCNAAETLLVHRAIAPVFLPAAAKALAERNVVLRGDAATQAIIACEPATETDWHTEYLDAILSIKVVDSLQEAIDHINRYGSHHTDAIISADESAVNRFMTFVDSADVFANCSTRFSDGFLYGFGAEVGIATGKLHARGPMGLEGLCTYKYRLYGSGQTLEALNRGEIALTHRDIKPTLD